ncbi:hypothetical protein BH11MYX1_BH11MYX1_52350 [soil metagenome]
MLLFIGLCFMVAGAWISSSVARSKGRDPALFGLMGALFPLITVIVALCMANRSLDPEVRI